MAKLVFRYGAMGSSKTANALMVRFNYLERGHQVALLKPKIECRDGLDLVKSRIGLEAKCSSVEDFLAHPEIWDRYQAIVVDEVQFLQEEQIEKFAEIVDTKNIPVICYGLRTDFQGRLFSGSKRLFELADSIEEIPTICWCGHKARFNARLLDGKVIKTGEQFQLGGNESYIALCRKHYQEGKWHA